MSGEQDTAGQVTVSVPPGYGLNIREDYEESVQSLKMVGVGVAGGVWGWQAAAARSGCNCHETQSRSDATSAATTPPPPPPLDGSSQAGFLVPEFWVSARKDHRERNRVLQF